MESLKIEIINPKAKKLLKDLAEMKLISILPQTSLKLLLKKLRKNEDKVPSIEDIAALVNEEREMRYGKKD
ncbi:MAG: hypothetical protein PF574_05975 [Candidatus Delongbacteria bacterium]|jgi:hypothetical protein|nr:hypothetical protein [Candidatus Delongbacteria bacterium]